MSYITYPVIFNGVTISTLPGVTIISATPHSPANRTLDMNLLTRSSKSKVAGAFFTSKDIEVKLVINASTRAELQQRADVLMSYLYTPEAELIFEYAGANRKYTATLYSATNNSEMLGSFVEMVLVFRTSDPFGYDTTYTTPVNGVSVTAAARTDSISFGGSAPTQVPVITIAYSAIGGGTSETVSIGNGSSSQTLTITRTWSSTDTLIVDVLNGTVKVNGTEVDYTGAIPEFEPGSRDVTYGDTFSSRTFTYTIKYLKRYI